MSLCINIFHGQPQNPGISSTHHHFREIQGPVITGIEYFRYLDGNFYLDFSQKFALDKAIQATRWKVIDSPSCSSLSQALQIQFTDSKQHSISCINPLTQDMMAYVDFYLDKEYFGPAMQMIVMTTHPHGQNQVVLEHITAMTFIHGSYTLWFANEQTYKAAKEETGWEDGHDEFSLVFPVKRIISAMLF